MVRGWNVLKDKWYGNLSLREAFPALFSIALGGQGVGSRGVKGMLEPLFFKTTPWLGARGGCFFLGIAILNNWQGHWGLNGVVDPKVWDLFN